MPTRMAMDKLKNDLVIMGEMCENALDTAVMALLDRDQDLAYYVIDYDKEIDESELAIDRQCIDLMADANLTGDSLRFVAAAMKIANDLERVGDFAVEITEHVLFLIREKSVLPQVVDFMDLVNQVAQMMRESIQALLEYDTELAWKIIDERQIAEEEMQLIFRELLEIMQKDARTIERCCHIMFIAQFALRVAEKAANVAEEVIYASEGVMVRHHLGELHPVTHVPLEAEERSEVEALEASLADKGSDREKTRKAHAAAKKKVTQPSKEEVQAVAQAARDKAHDARKKMLKLRARHSTN